MLNLNVYNSTSSYFDDPFSTPTICMISSFFPIKNSFFLIQLNTRVLISTSRQMYKLWLNYWNLLLNGLFSNFLLYSKSLSAIFFPLCFKNENKILLQKSRKQKTKPRLCNTCYTHNVRMSDDFLVRTQLHGLCSIPLSYICHTQKKVYEKNGKEKKTKLWWCFKV